jgi:PleD family two-component response regulator
MTLGEYTLRSLGPIRVNTMIGGSVLVSRYRRCAETLKAAAENQSFTLADRDFLTGLANHYEHLADDLEREIKVAIASSSDVLTVPKAA